ncbi:MAG: murein hydrolase activator EnvC family protein [Thermodesulfobacteriota bacterium]
MTARISVFLSCILGLQAMLVASPWADNSSEKRRSFIEATRSQIKEIEQHLAEQQRELFSVDSKEKDILGEVEGLEIKASHNRAALREAGKRIQEIEHDINDSRNRIKKLNHSLRDVETCFARRLVAFYKFGRTGYLELLMGCESFQDLIRTIRYMSSILGRDRELLDEVEQKRDRVKRELAGLEENMEALEVLRKAKDARRKLLEKYIEGRIYMLMKIRREKEFYGKAVKELKQAAHELNQTMIQLETDEKQAFLPDGLAHMKGKLLPPLQGAMIRNPHKQGSNPLIHKKGVFIAGSPGEKVLSVFSGRVDYSGWFKGYGQLMVVNHGAHYFTLFAHLQKRAKEKGERVLEGEPVGIVGDPGWDLGPGVYFEIRRAGEHLDPGKWLGVN